MTRHAGLFFYAASTRPEAAMGRMLHISDLHLGRDRATDAAAEALARALEATGAEAVILTGDVTHRGRRLELLRFERLFGGLGARLVVVPGNHDRMGDDAAEALRGGARVSTRRLPGLHVVRFDSTAPHNRSALASHGALRREDVEEIEAAVDAAPAGAVVALALHHHLLPLPADHLGELLATLLGWPHGAELARGGELLQRLAGRCDLVLHGHRHAPSSVVLLGAGGRALRVLNAGSTPELGRYRVLSHEDGRVTGERWEAFLPAAARAAPAARSAAA